MDDLKNPPIAYSCYYTRHREGEQFVREHVFSYQISGTLTVNTGDAEHISREGDFRFIKRNQLLKFVKQPGEQGVFKSLSIYLDQATLKDLARDLGIENPKNHVEAEKVIPLPERPLFKSFMDSLLPYVHSETPINYQLALLKQREALLILLQAHPELKDILFDFSAPGKIDLEAFMNKNFQFNVHLDRFAYLTGRSLATFKRDFERIFKMSPSKWLQQRRLQEAHYLIAEKGKAPSNVYLQTGFENLSHFSFAFKKMYGISPSRLV
ncbi:helix-turn-helix transcriptional regulator [Flavobacterium sp. MAH-1]|uniref:Helix-turn-helix transcriptional regulator n=1 Tax=Flavobacterium agri TaxID=2743471 RepID=A0A7Y8XZF3_9FLAO|nr:AraC family transcriptional regulator [Flavobacterium agri]NUY79536.1 helix-turn-helix transcriptional regulator [Flavobacterium agri]NYA69561.1 helix-turn-helix transcriptional regulator [Flavobacterium agri]